jgi:hypothetical protein
VKLTLLLTPDGKVLASVPEGTFEEARVAILAVLRDLGFDGLPLVLETPIERHRHDAGNVTARHDVHEHPSA